jgi:hypothetical protein
VSLTDSTTESGVARATLDVLVQAYHLGVLKDVVPALVAV